MGHAIYSLPLAPAYVSRAIFHTEVTTWGLAPCPRTSRFGDLVYGSSKDMTTRSSQRLLAITNGLSLRSGKALDARDDDSE